MVLVEPEVSALILIASSEVALKRFVSNSFIATFKESVDMSAETSSSTKKTREDKHRNRVYIDNYRISLTNEDTTFNI